VPCPAPANSVEPILPDGVATRGSDRTGDRLAPHGLVIRFAGITLLIGLIHFVVRPQDLGRTAC
jgi:hypothetical protein